jgi:hypothetical protein
MSEYPTVLHWHLLEDSGVGPVYPYPVGIGARVYAAREIRREYPYTQIKSSHPSLHVANMYAATVHGL